MGPKKEKENSQQIQVAVRCRALNQSEKKNGCHSVLEACPIKKEVSIKERQSNTVKTYCFDKVFGINSSQDEVYQSMVAPILEEVLAGYNCTIFAYGLTGTGKTYTMEGERSSNPSTSWEDDPQAGIIPRAMNNLFQKLQNTEECEFSVKVSYLELYNEELIDLLGAESVTNPRIKIYEDVKCKGSTVVHGLEEVVVNNKEEVYAILQQGSNRRQKAATLLNANSSRSHSIFMVTLHIKENSVDGEELLKTAKLNLVDLAGSECIGRSGAVDKRAREAGNINQSLLTLGRCIYALVEHAPHVPYRESKLTRLLQDSLGGRTKTSIIATISPAHNCVEETMSTLDYANRAKSITNRPEQNQKTTKRALLKEYTGEIERLRRDLQASRDKNGIFLATENYEAMQVQIAQQSDSIVDMENRILYLNEEINKVSTLFTFTQSELTKTQDSLSECSRHLEELKEEMRMTRVALKEMTQARYEQQFLVGEHIKTESDLFDKANQLLQTSDVAVSDVSGLQEKIDKIKLIELKNVDTEAYFIQDYNENIDEIKKSLQDFTSSQLESNTHRYQSLEKLSSMRSTQFSQLCENLENLHKHTDDGIDMLISKNEGHIESSTKWIEELQKTSKENCSKQNENTSQFYQNVFCDRMQKISLLVKSYEDEMKKQIDSMQKEFESNRKVVYEFISKKTQLLESQNNIFHSLCENVTKNSSECKAVVKQCHEDYNRKGENIMKTHMQMVKDMYSELLKLPQEHSALIYAKQDQFDVIVDDHQVKYEDASLQCESHLDEFKKTCTAHNEKDDKLIQDVSMNLKRKFRLVEESNDEVHKDVTKFTENQTNAQKEILENYSSATNSHKQYMQEVSNNVKNDMNAIKSTNTNDKEMIKQQQDVLHEEFQTFVTRDKSISEENTVEINKKSSLVNSGIENSQKIVCNLLGSGLQKYKPTGQTPQRRDFSYPKDLKKTRRHSILLKDFRKDYLLNEAANAPVSNESFGSLANDISTHERSCCSSQSSENESDLNGSFDSAVSSSSLTSSAASRNHSDQLFYDDKENMGPPSSRTVKKKDKKRIVTPNKTKILTPNKTTTTPTNKGKNTPTNKGSAKKALLSKMQSSDA